MILWMSFVHARWQSGHIHWGLPLTAGYQLPFSQNYESEADEMGLNFIGV